MYEIGVNNIINRPYLLLPLRSYHFVNFDYSATTFKKQ